MKRKRLDFASSARRASFERRIVVGVHVIEAENLVTVSQQTLRDMKADKACGPRDENRTVSHCARLA